MERTRVGYSGGTKTNPTYRSLGDHSETIQIDFNPAKISYEELLDVFWYSHDPTVQTWTSQYMSVIFYHNDEQKTAIEKSKNKWEKKTGRKIKTLIEPYEEFYLAEDYHQKYRLRMDSDILREFKFYYPETEDFVNSKAVTRVNGYLYGYGDVELFEKEAAKLGLSEKSLEKVKKSFKSR